MTEHSFKGKARFQILVLRVKTNEELKAIVEKLKIPPPLPV